jgi:hypothetical protein
LLLFIISACLDWYKPCLSVPITDKNKLQREVFLDLFEEFAQRLKVHPQKAQVLLALPDQQVGIERALSVLSIHKINWDEYKILKKINPTIILIFLISEDLSEAVKRLSEAGFTKLKGLNSQMDVIANP